MLLFLSFFQSLSLATDICNFLHDYFCCPRTSGLLVPLAPLWWFQLVSTPVHHDKAVRYSHGCPRENFSMSKIFKSFWMGNVRTRCQSDHGAYLAETLMNLFVCVWIWGPGGTTAEMLYIECWSHGERIYLDEGTSYHVTLLTLTQRSRWEIQQVWT